MTRKAKQGMTTKAIATSIAWAVVIIFTAALVLSGVLFLIISSVRLALGM